MERFNDVVEAVDSIYNQRYKEYEILLVIDRNEILYKELQNRLSDKVRIIVSDKKGLSNARNEGIKNSKYEIVAFLDDDAVAEQSWLSSLLNNFRDKNVISVGGKIVPLWQNSRPKWFAEELDWIVGCTYKGHPEKRCLVRNVIGCNMAFRKDVFDKIGLFEISVGRFGKKLLAGEEMELCYRALNEIQDSLIIYDPEAVVHHKVRNYRQTKNYSRERAFNEGLSKANIKKLHKNRSAATILSTENTYTKYLVTKSIPERIMSAVKGHNSLNNIRQINAIISMTSLVIIGYIAGSVR
jgi:GT2 family glycosyltransferase